MILIHPNLLGQDAVEMEFEKEMSYVMMETRITQVIVAVTVAKLFSKHPQPKSLIQRTKRLNWEVNEI